MNKVVFWDFDGTLVYFAHWRLAVMDVLNEYEPGHGIDPDAARPFLKNVYPWHKPEEPHPHLCSPDAWWGALEPVFARCYEGLGFPHERSITLASQVRRYMTMPQRYFLYEDTISALAELKNMGWQQVILSNHMPELPAIVDALGLSPYIELCISSAATGYEKPNPQAFHIAVSAANQPEISWMVGDNPLSDIKGAEAVGIPAILVHNNEVQGVKYSSPDLRGAAKIIKSIS